MTMNVDTEFNDTCPSCGKLYTGHSGLIPTCKQLQDVTKQRDDLLKVIDKLNESQEDLKFRLRTVKTELVNLYDKLIWLIPQGGRYKRDT